VALTVRRGGQPWHFLVHVYQKADNTGRVLLVRGYAPARTFKQHEGALRKALEGFRPGK
jgi:hypothetical protein